MIDPTKVVRSALQNAASIASLLLTTEAVITQIPEKYLTPGIQRDLRNKENGAVQTVLEVLERRRAAAHKTVHPDTRSAATKLR